MKWRLTASAALAALLLTGCGAKTSAPAGPPSGASRSVTGRSVTTFAGQAVWFQGGRRYRAGLHAVDQVTVPLALEQVLVGWGGAAALLKFSSGKTHAAPGVAWEKTIRVGDLHSFTVNGRLYTVPPADVGEATFVLPIAAGIVWGVHRAKTPPAPPVSYGGGLSHVSAQEFQGSTEIYYTPYTAKGGPLTKGARAIADVPDAFTSLNGPFAASAWTGWLPPASVLPAEGARVVAHVVHYSKAQRIVSDALHTQSVPGWPTLFLRQVGTVQPGKMPCVVTGLQLDRTVGGIVLQVQLWDANHGMSAGMSEADYYWSQASARWTPLAQLYGVQALVSFMDVGSRAVYWQEALPLPGATDGGVILAQMRFDPKTRAMTPVWAGGFLYAQTFVDGSAWVHDEPSRSGKAQWSANAP